MSLRMLTCFTNMLFFLIQHFSVGYYALCRLKTYMSITLWDFIFTNKSFQYLTVLLFYDYEKKKIAQTHVYKYKFLVPICRMTILQHYQLECLILRSLGIFLTCILYQSILLHLTFTR